MTREAALSRTPHYPPEEKSLPASKRAGREGVTETEAWSK
jgi:hypothetical protein